MRNLVAFYQTKSQAEAVRDELINAGFSRGDIKLQSPSSSGQEEKGFWESIKEAFGYAEEEDRHLYAEASRRGAYSVSLQIDNDDQPTLQTRAEEIMRRHNPVNLEEQAAKWRSEGWSGRYAQQPSTAATTQATASQATRRETRRTEGEEVIPVVQEELQVGKRQVQQGGVRIHSRVTERPVEEKVNLREEHVNVERRPVNRPVTSADVAFKERAIEATETSEQAVINKQARVVEEVALNKQVQERTETVRDTFVGPMSTSSRFLAELENRKSGLNSSLQPCARTNAIAAEIGTRLNRTLGQTSNSAIPAASGMSSKTKSAADMTRFAARAGRKEPRAMYCRGI